MIIVMMMGRSMNGYYQNASAKYIMVHGGRGVGVHVRVCESERVGTWFRGVVLGLGIPTRHAV